jgi:hypothetical protein
VVGNLADGSGCSTGNFCLVGQTCKFGLCLGGTARVCGDECNTDGGCDQTNAVCLKVPLDNGVTPCQGGAGLCWNGGCCTGCVNVGCEPGNTPAACGKQGQTCVACPNSKYDCLLGACACKGCFAGSLFSKTCNVPMDPTHCGPVNGNCKTCPANACQDATCSPTGACGTLNHPDGSACPKGVCVGGACCAGCTVTSGSTLLCRPGNTNAECGVGGASCSTCSPTEACTLGLCVTS